MMNGMMGSLLVVNKGTKIKGENGILQSGFFDTTVGEVLENTVTVKNITFAPSLLTVPDGTKVIFEFQEPNHTVVTTNVNKADPITINNGGGDTDAVPPGEKREVTINGEPGGVIEYWCGIHTTMMRGTIRIESPMGPHGGGH
jgi:plastocyanin